MTETVSAQAPRRKMKWLLVTAAGLALVAGIYWYLSGARAAKQAGNGKGRPAPVAVAEARTQDVEVFLSGLGTVTPLGSVTIKSRVDGQLMQVLAKEGQAVKAGELLLVIDPRPFLVQLAQAEGQLRRDTALLENARLDLKRFGELVTQGAIARQQYDTQQALVHQYEGTVASDKAQADSARLQITYSRITSPISGQVGLRQVDPGNMVRASDQTGLLVVNQLSPITVLFTLPEDQLPRVLAKLREGQKLRVDAYDREQTKKLAQGELSSLDNQIDTGTGTVRLKASFANAQGELYPNQFVNAKLLVDVLQSAVVVPAAAVQRGQQGTYLYVLTPESTASARPVSVGETADGQIVVLSGLAPGEKVVVDGADRLRDGAPVEVKVPGGRPQAKPEATPEAAKPEAKPEAKPSEAPPAKAAAKPVPPVPAAKAPETKAAEPKAPEAQPADAPAQDAASPAPKPAPAEPQASPQPRPVPRPAPKPQAGSAPQAGS